MKSKVNLCECCIQNFLFVQTTCQDHQNNEATFGIPSEAFITHSATNTKVNIHYFIILVFLFYALHRFCNSSYA